MSLRRFVYYSAVIGGWAAFWAWLARELLFLRTQRLGGSTAALATGAFVGAILGAGLNLVSGMTNAQWKWQVRHITPGLVGGGLGGSVGALVGALMYSLGLPRAIGWAVMGLGIGISEGLWERSRRKFRNGLIGGVMGGLIGGMLFDPIHDLVPAGLGSFSRATAFVILGISIGALVGLAQVALKEAWLTVVDGFRPGRQLILGQTVTMLGRGDHLALPFLGYSGKDLESEHLRIVRQPDGVYQVEDNHSRLGTRLNGQVIQGPTPLTDGDLIKLGTNIVRFNHRHRSRVRLGGEGASAASDVANRAPPPPPAAANLPAGTASRPPVPWMQPRTPISPSQPGSPPQAGSPLRIPPPPPPPGTKR